VGKGEKMVWALFAVAKAGLIGCRVPVIKGRKGTSELPTCAWARGRRWSMLFGVVKVGLIM
jgi:hypothetical protein